MTGRLGWSLDGRRGGAGDLRLSVPYDGSLGMEQPSHTHDPLSSGLSVPYDGSLGMEPPAPPPPPRRAPSLSVPYDGSLGMEPLIGEADDVAPHVFQYPM